MHPIRIVLADDHEIFRNGFKLLLQKQTEIVLAGEAANGRQLLALIERTAPDVALVDVQMPEMNGIDACRQIKENHFGTAVIALTTFNDDHCIVDMLQAGANGYLLKNTTREELQKAVRLVSEGGMYYSPEALKKLVRLQAEKKVTPGRVKPPIKLTDRELKIMELVCKQLTNKEMAAELGLSSRTVESHRERIQEKINAKNTAGIVLYAVQHNLFDL